MTENTNSASVTTTTNGSSNLEIAQSNQDLILSKEKKKKRVWIISGVICAIVVALIIAAIVLLTMDTEESESPSSEALTLEDFLNYKYNPTSFNGTWTSGNELLYSDANANVVLLNLEDKSSKVLLYSNESSQLLLTAFDFKLSSDGSYLSVAYNYQKLYRHSYKARYTLVNLGTGGNSQLQTADGKTDLQLVEWAPTGNGVAFVYENNIYYKNSAETEDVVQITSTTGFISNGVPDWVYEEEVFSSNKALWFSPDSSKLAFARFNDSQVPIMVIPIYGEPGSLVFQYPRANFVKYPKAGATNPNVSLHVVDLASPTTEVELGPPDALQNSEPILTAVAWATNETLVAIWTNRVQNEAAIVAYQTTSPYSTVLIKSLSSTNGWLELFTPPIFSKDGSQLVVLLSQDQGNSLGSYRHIALLNVEQDATIQGLTSGAYVVTEILAWNHDDNLIYYTANTESDPGLQHLYSISPDTKTITCLTCDSKSKNNQSANCLYNTAEFSKDAANFVHTCAGPETPHISVLYKNGTEQLEWTVNEELHSLTNGKQVPTRTTLEFDVAGGFKARVLLKLPPNLDTSGETKYPLLVNVYGGPDTYQVTEKYTLDWGSYLAANKSIIYAAIDGRGSGLRGDNLLFAGYRNLGTVEIADQVNVTKLIQNALPYVDSSRTAIWGWSYGGYAAGMALATDTDNVFQCGISVAPVTDWTLYDSIYTERFMGLPTESDNYDGYYNSQLLTKYAGLEGKQYFLIHGTYDDNVHYQQSMMWAKVLERNDILFRQLSYPDEDHGLGSVRPHLYHSLENFLDECFEEEE